MIELEIILVSSMNLFLCCVYHGQIIYRVYVNLSSYSLTHSCTRGEAQSDCTKYCECLYIIDAI